MQGVVGSSPTRGANFGGQFDNSSRKSLFYKDFFGLLGEILRKYFVTTFCEPSGLELWTFLLKNKQLHDIISK
jgi:hypothetical protein